MPPKWEEAPIVERAEQRGDQPRPSQGPITVVPGSANKGRKSAAEARAAEIEVAKDEATLNDIIEKAALENDKASVDLAKAKLELLHEQGKPPATLGAPKEGYEYFEKIDPDTGEKKWAMRPVEGGPADKTSKKDLQAALEEAGNVVRAAYRAKQASKNGWFTTGFGADWMKGIGGTKAKDVASDLQTIAANTAFDRLSRMRAESPTGGALGQVSEIELKLLRDSITSLEQSQSDEAFQASMDRVMQAYGNVYAKIDPEGWKNFNPAVTPAQAKGGTGNRFLDEENKETPTSNEVEGGQVGGQDIRGYRYSPGAETDILQYVSGPHDAAGLAELYTKKALEEGIIRPDQAESYRQQAMLSAENFVAQTGGKGVKATGLDYSDVDKGATKGAGLGESLLQGAANIPESAAQLAQGLVALPADAVLSVLSGERVGSIKSTTDLVAELAAQAGIGDAEPETLRAMGDYLESRWGGWDNIKSSLIKDPVGMAGDLSLVLTGGGSIAARGPGVVGSTGRAVATAGRAIDPLSAGVTFVTEGAPAAAAAVRNSPTASKVTDITTSLPGLTERYLTGLSSGAGHRSLAAAFDVGVERGKAGAPTPRSEGFTANMRGDGDMDSMIAQADEALKNMREEASQRYRSGMLDVSNDADILSFDDIDNALGDLSKRAYYKGQVRDKRAAEAYTRIRDTVEEWRGLDPAQYHTAEGMDALKQRVGDIAEDFSTGNDRRAASIATGMYKAVKKTIQDQVPTYADTMKDYEKASQTMSEVRKAFSLNNTAAADTKLRKLLSIGRNNVNTNFGYRDNLADLLEQYVPAGGESLVDNILAQNLSSVAPRGINRALAGGVASSGLGGAALGGLEGASGLLSPWNLAALPFMSPRLMGEMHYGAGRVAGAAQRWGENVGEALAPHAGKAMDFYQKNQTPFLGAAQFGSGMEGIDELLSRYSDANPDVPEGGQSLEGLGSRYLPAGEAGPAPAQPVQEVVIGGQVYLLDTETQQLLDPATGQPVPMGAANVGAQ